MKVSFNNPVVKELSRLKSDIIYSALLGRYKDYKTSVKAYSKLAVDNFEYLSQVKTPQTATAPLFSKVGLNMLKIKFLEMFRLKTPAEKQLRRMAEEFRIRQKIK